MSTLNVILLGSFIGVAGTGLGGAITYLFKKPSNRFLSSIMGIAAGLMLSVVTFDLLPHAFEIGDLTTGILGIVIGVLLVTVFDELIPQTGVAGNKYIKEGIILGLAIAIHNFPEGLAVGSGFMAAKSLGISIAFVIALHDLPEGIAMATPMAIGGVSPLKNVLYTVLAGIPTSIGTIVGVVTGGMSTYFISLNLGIAGGAMLYVICGEMIPQSRNIYRGRISVFGMILGIIGGIIITELL